MVGRLGRHRVEQLGSLRLRNGLVVSSQRRQQPRVVLVAPAVAGAHLDRPRELALRGGPIPVVPVGHYAE